MSVSLIPKQAQKITPRITQTDVLVLPLLPKPVTTVKRALHVKPNEKSTNIKQNSYQKNKVDYLAPVPVDRVIGIYNKGIIYGY